MSVLSCFSNSLFLNKKNIYIESYKKLKNDMNYFKKKGVLFKKSEDIHGISMAGKLIIDTFDFIDEKIKPGVTTKQIDFLVHKFTVKYGGIPAPLNYRGYPKSICTSVNDVICHGIPSNRILLDGDIINVDITSILNGYYADASKSYCVGKVNGDAEHVVNVAKKCLKLGIAKIKPGNTTYDIGSAIQIHAESQGCSVVREFVGHGIGLNFHERPQIPHYVQSSEFIKLIPNMVFTVEPMVNLGSKEINILSDGWTAVTKDGSLSAQFEQTVCVTETGCISLTPYNL